MQICCFYCCSWCIWEIPDQRTVLILSTDMGHMQKWNKNRFSIKTKPQRGKVKGEATLCFCLMEHNMSVLYGLAITFYKICNASCQNEGSHAKAHAATLNAIHFNLKQFCIVYRHSICFSCFLSSYARALYCHFLFNQCSSSSQS